MSTPKDEKKEWLWSAVEDQRWRWWRKHEEEGTAEAWEGKWRRRVGWKRDEESGVPHGTCSVLTTSSLTCVASASIDTKRLCGRRTHHLCAASTATARECVLCEPCLPGSTLSFWTMSNAIGRNASSAAAAKPAVRTEAQSRCRVVPAVHIQILCLNI